MLNTQSRFAVVLALAIGLSASACTKKEEAPTPPSAAEIPAATTAPQTPAAPAAPTGKVDTDLKIGTDGDNMAFDKTELSAKAGSTVRVTFTNNSKNSGLQHNWLLAKPGTENDVAAQGTAAGEDHNWIQEGPNVIAHTKLLKNPGDSDSVTFTAPPAGDYPFICTFPGHAMAMKGTFHSK